MFFIEIAKVQLECSIILVQYGSKRFILIVVWVYCSDYSHFCTALPASGITLFNKESGANPSVLISDVGPRLPEKTDKDFKIDPLFACRCTHTPHAGSQSPYSGLFFSVNCLGSRLRNSENALSRQANILAACDCKYTIFSQSNNKTCFIAHL